MTTTLQDIEDVKDALLSIIVHSIRLRQLSDQEFERLGKEMTIDFELISDRFEYIYQNIGILRRQFQKQRNEEIKNDERRKNQSSI